MHSSTSPVSSPPGYTPISQPPLAPLVCRPSISTSIWNSIVLKRHLQWKVTLLMADIRSSEPALLMISNRFLMFDTQYPGQPSDTERVPRLGTVVEFAQWKAPIASLMVPLDLLSRRQHLFRMPWHSSHTPSAPPGRSAADRGAFEFGRRVAVFLR